MIRKKKNNKLLVSLLVILIAINLINTVLLLSVQKGEKELEKRGFEIQNVSLEGYVEADVSLDGQLLQFDAECRRISMMISEAQAYSIDLALANETPFRPMTQDIMRDMMRSFGIELKLARITKFENDVYYAQIVVKSGNKTLILDSRPSDATALALRFGIPIYINKDLLQEYGEAIC